VHNTDRAMFVVSLEMTRLPSFSMQAPAPVGFVSRNVDVKLAVTPH